MKIVKVNINKSAIEMLEKSLEKVKNGEVVAVTIMEEYSDTTYKICGSKSANRLQTVGMLFDAILTRLGVEYED